MEEIKFEKVSEEQFTKDCLNCNPLMSKEAIKQAYDGIILPTRGTTGAAGYDIRTPIAFVLEESTSPITIPTGLRIKIPSNKFLMILPRSGLGFKTGVGLANTIGIIDSDYINSKNEGHIMMKLVAGFADMTALTNERIAQGIIMDYYTTSDDNTTETRTGGFGSTGVK